MYRQVDSFDGQTITVDNKPCYELGGFLGGGAAGVVYEVSRMIVFDDTTAAVAGRYRAAIVSNDMTPCRRVVCM